MYMYPIVQVQLKVYQRVRRPFICIHDMGREGLAIRQAVVAQLASVNPHFLVFLLLLALLTFSSILFLPSYLLTFLPSFLLTFLPYFLPSFPYFLLLFLTSSSSNIFLPHLFFSFLPPLFFSFPFPLIYSRGHKFRAGQKFRAIDFTCLFPTLKIKNIIFLF